MRLNASKYNRHWQDKTLNELGDFQRGKSRYRPRNDMALFSGGKHPLIQTGEIKEANLFITKHSATYNDFGLAQSKLWPQNTLCITIAANIAETALLGYPMCFPDSVVGFNAYPNESSELFMHYVFTYIRRAIQNSATGSIQDNINIEYLTSLKFKIPLKDYQDKIAAVLSALDAKIACNNRINAELEAMAKTLYDYWFVQFNFPDANGKPYKSSGGKMVYNATLKREIPAGWEVKTIGEYAEVKKGDLITAKDTKDGDVKVVAAGVDFSYTHSDFNRDTNTITISGSGANAGFINFWREPIFASDCITVRGATDTETLLLLHHLKFIQSHILSQATGSAQPHVYPSDIKILDYVIPTDILIDSFGKLATPMNNQIAINIKENQHLTQLRDWLLPMLMNGQVTVA
jgi:type I restriction enzyme S subunit